MTALILWPRSVYARLFVKGDVNEICLFIDADCFNVYRL
jgi:hypothetical protein